MKIRIFTDGACSENPGPGGWAAVFNLTNECKTFTGNEQMTTNNRMELKAVIESFKRIIQVARMKKIAIGYTSFELFSDSAYVVNSINNGWIDKWQQNNWKTTKGDDVKNKDLWEEFVMLKNEIKARKVNVSIIKIKGHVGNTFNELADKLAKEESIKAKEEASI